MAVANVTPLLPNCMRVLPSSNLGALRRTRRVSVPLVMSACFSCPTSFARCPVDAPQKSPCAQNQRGALARSATRLSRSKRSAPKRAAETSDGCDGRAKARDAIPPRPSLWPTAARGMLPCLPNTTLRCPATVRTDAHRDQATTRPNHFRSGTYSTNSLSPLPTCLHKGTSQRRNTSEQARKQAN